MNTIQAISANSLTQDKLFAGSTARTNYLWKNLIIEKKSKIGRAYKYYGRNIFADVWSMFTSPLT